MRSRMNDCQITINAAVVAVSSTAGVALVLGACAGQLRDPWADLGVVLALFAALRTVAGWLSDWQRMLEIRDAGLERNAFELGRDAQIRSELDIQ